MHRDVVLEHRSCFAAGNAVLNALSHEGIYQYCRHTVHLVLRVNRYEVHLKSVVAALERLEHMQDTEWEKSAVCLLERLGKRGYHNAKGNYMTVGILYRADIVKVNEGDIVIYHILDNTAAEQAGKELNKAFREDFTAETLEKLRLGAIEARKGKPATGDAEFEAYLEMDDDKIDWHPAEKINDLYVYSAGDVTVKVLKGLSGVSTEKVVLSDLNGGAITNMPDDYMAEFTHIADKDGIHRMEGLAVPTPVLGKVMELATYQTLVAKACVTEDPKDLLTALCAYPLSSTLNEAKELWAKQLMVSENFIPASFMKMPELY